MHLHSHHDAFLTYIAKYLGIALIAGSVVHIGTLQNGVTRYVVLIIIGLILTILGGLKEAKAKLFFDHYRLVFCDWLLVRWHSALSG